MNVEEAIKRLESFNYKVYLRDGKWSVWYPTCKNNDPRYRYTNRELIRFAKNTCMHKNWTATGKYKTGPGGIICPCCTKMSLSDLKVKYRRSQRRKDKQNFNKDVE